jgi:hypothetical protein
MSDKFPWMAAETGTYSTSAPDPHIDLDGTEINFGTVFPSRTFAAAAADSDVDFDDGDTCQITVVEISDKGVWAVYEGVPWADATPDTLDLSSGTKLAGEGVLTDSVAVNVWASPPKGRFMPDAEGKATGTTAQVNSSGAWVTST